MAVNLLEVCTPSPHTYSQRRMNSSTCTDVRRCSPFHLPGIFPLFAELPYQFFAEDEVARACTYPPCTLRIAPRELVSLRGCDSHHLAFQERGAHEGDLRRHDRDARCTSKAQRALHMGVLHQRWKICDMGWHAVGVLQGVRVRQILSECWCLFFHVYTVAMRLANHATLVKCSRLTRSRSSTTRATHMESFTRSTNLVTSGTGVLFSVCALIHFILIPCTPNLATRRCQYGH